MRLLETLTIVAAWTAVLSWLLAMGGAAVLVSIDPPSRSLPAPRPTSTSSGAVR